MELQGYAANEAAADLANQRTVGGSAQVTLSDNTTITFAGIARVTASMLS